ncbi:MAG: hypothetical protein ACI857_003433 [Arenicella sp.]|jgi:hypothetical protein
MKKFTQLFFLLSILILSSCSGSDTYRGDWKATDMQGAHYDITFEAKNFIMKDANGESSSFGYTQNSVNINNSVETYGIKLDDGRSYQINFPIADDESVGTMADGNGYVIYTICKDEYKEYADIFSLN